MQGCIPCSLAALSLQDGCIQHPTLCSAIREMGGGRLDLGVFGVWGCDPNILGWLARQKVW